MLRYQAQLDFLIEHYSRRGVSKLDFEVLLAMRMGVYQLRYLDRVPPHAAVSQSVELVKSMGFRSATGFANAVLRKVGREPVAWPDRAVELSHPEWLLARWDRQFGPEVTPLIARANLLPPETYIRIPAGRAIPAGTSVEPTEVPGCYRLVAGEADGFRIQDIGSQSIVPLLDLAPGQSFLDLCAAPGNKTAQALESGVRAVACDFHAKRVEMRTCASSLGHPMDPEACSSARDGSRQRDRDPRVSTIRACATTIARRRASVVVTARSSDAR